MVSARWLILSRDAESCSRETGTSSAVLPNSPPGLPNILKVESAVLDGEIACVDDLGPPCFRDLLFRRRQCVFIAFDLLYLNGKDLHVLPLLERKAILKRLLRRKQSRILYLDHVETDGVLLFQEVEHKRGTQDD